MNKPIKPNISFPSGFALNGQKTDFTQQKIQNGFNPVEPDILAGDNLNKFIDDTYKSITYSNSGVADLYRSAVVYDSNETYYQNSIVFNVDNNGKVLLYLSKTDNNVGNSLNDANYWEVIQLGAVRNIGEIVSSVLPLSDAGLHLLDGALLSGSGSYGAFVDYITELYNDDPTANYFTTEANWQSSVTAYGVCGKFVVDTVNNTVRLPKITGIIEGTIDVNALGDLVQAGLPQHTHERGTQNITGNTMMVFGDGNVQQADGAFYPSGYYQIGLVQGSYNTGAATQYFDASRTWSGSTSNANYTNNLAETSNVQPQTIKAFVYIVVATSTKTDIQVDIDDIATDLNGKADTSLSNLSATGLALFNAKVNTDLNNLSATGQKVIDGQWVVVGTNISTANTVGSYTLDISSLLPADNYKYEVILACQMFGSGDIFYQSVYTTELPSSYVASTSSVIANLAVIPVGTNRIINYAITSNGNTSPNGAYLQLCAYRRIGTNS